jgi:hypothetical protein
MSETPLTRDQLTPPLREAVDALTAVQRSLRKPLADEAALEAIWAQLAGLSRSLPPLCEALESAAERQVARRCEATANGLLDALRPVREERRANMAVKRAIETFEQEVNRPAGEITSAAEGRRLLDVLEQLRWKLDSVPAGEPDSPRAQGTESLLDAMRFAREKIGDQIAAMEAVEGLAGAERALERIVQDAGRLDNPEEVSRVLSRLDALERSLAEHRPQLLRDPRAMARLVKLTGKAAGVREQVREIVQGREAARVVRNAIHALNAASKGFDRGPMTEALAENLRAHFRQVARELEGVRGHAMPAALKSQHAQIEAQLVQLLAQLEG